MNAAGEAAVNRYVVLYLATLVVIVPLDFLFLGMVAKGFFTAQIGDMLGEIRLVPAVLFYLLSVGAFVIFAGGLAAGIWQSTLFSGALWGLFCYATFDLTPLSRLKHGGGPAGGVVVSGGSFVTAVSSTAGLVIANWIAPRV